jgi:hypothetical protein
MSNRSWRVLVTTLVGIVVVCSSAHAQARAAGGPGTCDPAKLAGLWGGARYSMEILGDFKYRASGTPNMASIDVNGSVAVDKCSVKIVDVSGVYACPTVDVGRYTFTVTDTTLTFTLVSDPCDGRRIPLTAGPLTRRKASR